MAATTLTDVQLLVGAFELSAFTGGFDIGEETEMKVANNFAAKGYTVVVPGLSTATGSLSGWADYAAGGVSATFNGSTIGSQQAFTVVPTGSASAIGDPAQFMRGRLNKLAMQVGNVGDVTGFQMSVTGDYAGVDGYLLAPLTSRGAFTGTQVSGVPAVLASEQVFGVVHVTGAVGTNLAWTIQSASTADSGFASPTTRLTFATVSAVGWQMITIPGPITDTRWRAVATVGSSTFTSAVAFGVM